VKCAILYDKGWYVGDVVGAPSTGVLGIVYPDPLDGAMGVGTLTIQGWDYYLLYKEEWVGVNGSVDVIDHVINAHPQRVLKGRMVPRSVWGKAVKELNDFPLKSAKVPQFEEPKKVDVPGVTK
jgi:hypothetical protein